MKDEELIVKSSLYVGCMHILEAGGNPRVIIKDLCNIVDTYIDKMEKHIEREGRCHDGDIYCQICSAQINSKTTT